MVGPIAAAEGKVRTENRLRCCRCADLDTKFMAKLNIMDYSLLLGVQKQLAKLDHQGGPDDPHSYLPGHSMTAKSYHMGLIDILQTWDTKKWMERYAKAVLGRDIGERQCSASVDR